ncbi:hypothetical protein [Methylorubrum sp. SB2]|uniref:hypothetical protein n=1 Tax=Methylorubrum subtropicum TaxID=3138812 RepID=UPI00313B294F
MHGERDRLRSNDPKPPAKCGDTITSDPLVTSHHLGSHRRQSDPAREPGIGDRSLRLQRCLHTIKQSAGLRPNDEVIYDNGDVTGKLNGDEIGNLYDEH